MSSSRVQFAWKRRSAQDSQVSERGFLQNLQRVTNEMTRRSNEIDLTVMIVDGSALIQLWRRGNG